MQVPFPTDVPCIWPYLCNLFDTGRKGVTGITAQTETETETETEAETEAEAEAERMAVTAGGKKC